MADSMSSPWIRDYFMDVAETFGAQFYNAPASLSKKKVQLTEFLTYQEDSYVWAWMSDKDHRVSVRISKDAVESYKSMQRRSILDGRFSVVFISGYRPMFSPRPLRPNTTGNTPTSHMSLEIGHVKLVGIGGHLFGNPRDLESDENMKEWILGLRKDGGGGNVLKLRKQEKLEQNKKAPSSPPPFSLYAPVSQCHTSKPAEDTATPKTERPQDFKRTYTKRWQIIEVDRLRFRINPTAVESPDPCPPSPHHTPPRTSRLQQQGTPTDWSPSNLGSPVVPDTVTKSPPQRQDEPAVLPTVSNLPSDIETTSDTRSLQPPTPAQRIRRSPPPPSTPPSRSSPDRSSRHSPFPSQQLPCSFPPPPGSSLPPPFSSPPSPTTIRKNIQRKVPHPGLPVPRPDPTKQGPVQILVPNSDTSATGSSQSYSQSQHQLLLHSSALPLTKDFEPPDASTPRETKPGSLARHMSKMTAESSPTHCDTAGNGIASTVDQCGMENADPSIEKQEALESTRPPAPSLPRIEVLEVGTSDPEEDQLEWTQITARSEVASNTYAGTQGTGEGDADHEDNQLSFEKVHSPQKSPPRPCLPGPSVVQDASSNDQGTAGVSILLVRPGSPSSMHSLFSDSLEDERTVSPHTPVAIGQNVRVQEEASPTYVPKHDPEAWKRPSFFTMNKGKGKARAVEEPDTPSVKVGKKRRHSDQTETPVPKRLKVAAVAASEVHRTASGQADTKSIQPPVVEVSPIGKIHPNNRVSATPTDATDAASSSTVVQSSKPRLVNFAVDFERVDLGESVPIPLVDFNKDIKATLLRTGRIRTLGKNVEEDGKVYIMR